ncbi:unnamed protein product, partial [Allacma fusca]
MTFAGHEGDRQDFGTAHLFHLNGGQEYQKTCWTVGQNLDELDFSCSSGT